MSLIIFHKVILTFLTDLAVNFSLDKIVNLWRKKWLWNTIN